MFGRAGVVIVFTEGIVRFVFIFYVLVYGGKVLFIRVRRGGSEYFRFFVVCRIFRYVMM